MKTTLMALVLAGLAGSSAAAQGAEIIIRRPGQQDQVIQLDSMHTRQDVAKIELQLQQLGHVMTQQMTGLQQQLPKMAFKFDTLRLDSTAHTLALRAEGLAGKVPALLQWAMPSNAARPIIGVGIYVDGPRESDKYGAYITSVTPGGPAEKAGIRSGDIITRIDGKSLASTTATGNSDQSVPGLRLIEIASKLEVGKPIDVEYMRDRDTRTVKVTPMEDNSVVTLRAPAFSVEPGMSGMLSPVPDAPEMRVFGNINGAPAMPEMAVAPRAGDFTYSFGFGGALGNAELAALNDKLGAYFGATEGVLVVNTGGGPTAVVSSSALRDSVNPKVTLRRAVRTDPFGLEPGDVIVSVDGRKVTTPSQLMRILSSYDRGDEIKLQIMRQKHAETLTGKLP